MEQTENTMISDMDEQPMKPANYGIVSVIVPVYNTEKYLTQCLESIANQDYPYLEVIVIDDGSTDGSAEIAQSFMKVDGRFRVFSQANAGSSAARNKGLSVVTGKYVSFVDADDWIEPDFISSLLYNLIKHDAEVTMCNFEMDGKNEYDWSEKLMTSTEEIFYEYIRQGCCNRILNKIYKADLIKNILFPVGRNLVEDGAWTSSVLKNVTRLYRFPEAKYHYRTVNSSLSRSKKIKKEYTLCGLFSNLIDRHTVFYEVLKDMESRNMNTCQLWRNLDFVLTTWCDLSTWNIDCKIRFLFNSYHDEIYNLADPVQKKIMYCIINGMSMKKAMGIYVRNRLFSSSTTFQQRKMLIRRRAVSLIRPK